MKTTKISIAKKTYSAPQIEMIRLDNEISLQLASGAGTEDTDAPLEPGGTDWSRANSPINNDPYKMA